MNVHVVLCMESMESPERIDLPKYRMQRTTEKETSVMSFIISIHNQIVFD